jgi:hypothetical protein
MLENKKGFTEGGGDCAEMPVFKVMWLACGHGSDRDVT